LKLKYSGQVIGSFEDFSRNVGAILENAGVPDFLGNFRKAFEESDVDGGAWAVLVSAWFDRFGSNEVSASEIFALAQLIEDFTITGATERAMKTSFGMGLRKMRDRIIGDYRIILVPSKKHGAKYLLQKFDSGEPRGTSEPISPSNGRILILNTTETVSPTGSPPTSGLRASTS